MRRMQLRASGGGVCGCEHIREDFGVTFSETARGTNAAINCATTAGFNSNAVLRLGVSGVRVGTGRADWQHDTFRSGQQQRSFGKPDARTETCDANGNAASNRKAVNQRAIICCNRRHFHRSVNRARHACVQDDREISAMRAITRSLNRW